MLCLYQKELLPVNGLTSQVVVMYEVQVAGKKLPQRAVWVSF
jgi:hypothetical protein